jgi:stalled ribosome rescue protein Dom34
MPHAHAVVWLDHREAKVIQFNPEHSESQHVKHLGDDRLNDYYHSVATKLTGVREILVLGPGNAKTEFVKHLKDHDPAVANAVLGVESADHPSEGQILAKAREFFKAKDRMIAH